jgi:hypothetical protein
MTLAGVVSPRRKMSTKMNSVGRRAESGYIDSPEQCHRSPQTTRVYGTGNVVRWWLRRSNHADHGTG